MENYSAIASVLKDISQIARENSASADTIKAIYGYQTNTKRNISIHDGLKDYLQFVLSEIDNMKFSPASAVVKHLVVQRELLDSTFEEQGKHLLHMVAFLAQLPDHSTTDKV